MENFEPANTLPVIMEDKSNDTLIPSTPPAPEAVVVVEISSADVTTTDLPKKAVRKSTRPRKPKAEVVSATDESAAPATAPKAKRKYTKRTLETPAAPEMSSTPPAAKKARMESSMPPAPVIEVIEVIEESPVLEESVPTGVVDGVINVDAGGVKVKKPRKPKAPYVPADVPPIEGMPDYSKKTKVKRKSRPGPLPASASLEADLPPMAAPDASENFVVIAPPPVVAAEEHEDSNASKPLSSGAKTPMEKKSKKQIQMESFMKSQPSVLRFFVAPADAASPTKDEAMVEASPDADVTEPTHRGPPRPTYFAASPPEYMAEWKRMGAIPFVVRPRIFIQRSANRGEGVRVLDRSEIGSRKASVYAGDNPVARRRLLRPRPVYIAIHDRERPPVKLIVTHQSTAVSRRHPLGVDTVIDYEKDSDEEWEEEKEGEDLNSNADNEDEAAEEGAESEADSFFVSDGHFSEDEALSDDEAVVARNRRRNEMDDDGKATLQLITFAPSDLADADTYSSDEPARAQWFRVLIEEAGVRVADPTNYFNPETDEERKPKKVKEVKEPKPAKVEKPTVDWGAVRPELARFIHGMSSNIDGLCASFKSVQPEISTNAIRTEIRSIASYVKKAELSAKIAWYVKPELFALLGLTEEEMAALVSERRVVVVAVVKEVAAADPTAVPVTGESEAAPVVVTPVVRRKKAAASAPAPAPAPAATLFSFMPAPSVEKVAGSDVHVEDREVIHN